MIALVNGPCFSPHSLIEVDINVVRHSARLPTNIFTSHPHNAPGTLMRAVQKCPFRGRGMLSGRCSSRFNITHRSFKTLPTTR